MRYKLQHLIVFATFACCLNTTAEHYPGASEAFDIDGVTQRLRAAEDRHQAFDHKFKEATGRQTALHGQHRQLEKQFAVSGQHLAQHTRQIEKDRAALRQADADIAVAQDQIAEAKRCVAAAAGEANNLRQRLQQAQARLDRKQHELAELEIECATFIIVSTGMITATDMRSIATGSRPGSTRLRVRLVRSRPRSTGSTAARPLSRTNSTRSQMRLPSITATCRNPKHAGANDNVRSQR
jgi:hypothetical protein